MELFRSEVLVRRWLVLFTDLNEGEVNRHVAAFEEWERQNYGHPFRHNKVMQAAERYLQEFVSKDAKLIDLFAVKF